MSLTLKHANLMVIPGQTGRSVYQGFGAFTTTGTTVELAVPFKRITAFSITFVGTPAASDGTPSINETEANDQIAVPSDGKVTVTRAAGTTSGLKFSFIIYGY